MNRLLLIPMAALLMLSGARAAPSAPSYAVISLVGDQLDVVAYQPQIGSQLDSNTHLHLALSQDELDIAALRAINRSLHATLPGAHVALLAASTPDSFANQDRLFSGDQVTLPAEIDAAVRHEGAATLVLVSKHRGVARLPLEHGFIGSGKLEGLGYYMDTEIALHDVATGDRSVGYLAPYVYVDVSLVDVATGRLLKRASITAARVITTPNAATTVHPWDALTSEEKVSRLKDLLTSELEKTVPALVGGEAPKPAQ